MEDYVINTIVFGVISWTTLFLLVRKMCHKRSFGFCGRLVAIIHALSAIVLASSSSFKDWTSCGVSPTSSPRQMKILAFNVGYFIYDLSRFQFDKNRNKENVIHHSIIILGIGAALVYRKGVPEMVAGLWIGELPGPFNHSRELLKDLGRKDTKLSMIVDFSFAIAFTISRIICEPYVTYLVLTANNPLIIKALAIGLQLLGLFWFNKIMRVGTSKYLSNLRTSSQKIHPSHPFTKMIHK